VDEEICDTDPLQASWIPIDSDLDSVCDVVDDNDDNDGYFDYADYCPRSYGNSTIDWYGCPDYDGDGLADFSDSFPYDSSKSWDRDNDGIAEEQEGWVLEKIHNQYMPIPVFGLFVTIALVLVIVVSVISRREN